MNIILSAMSISCSVASIFIMWDAIRCGAEGKFWLWWFVLSCNIVGIIYKAVPTISNQWGG